MSRIGEQNSFSGEEESVLKNHILDAFFSPAPDQILKGKAFSIFKSHFYLSDFKFET